MIHIAFSLLLSLAVWFLVAKQTFFSACSHPNFGQEEKKPRPLLERSGRPALEPPTESSRDRFAERFWRGCGGGEAEELDRDARAKPGGLVK